MEEIEVGEYVRTKYGEILQITSPRDMGYIEHGNPYFKEQITKHSKNIIDLIEVGDYVNGCLVTDIYDEYKNDNTIQFEIDYEGRYYYYSDGDINSILTKEKYNANCYRLEE